MPHNSPSNPLKGVCSPCYPFMVSISPFILAETSSMSTPQRRIKGHQRPSKRQTNKTPNANEQPQKGTKPNITLVDAEKPAETPTNKGAGNPGREQKGNDTEKPAENIPNRELRDPEKGADSLSENVQTTLPGDESTPGSEPSESEATEGINGDTSTANESDLEPTPREKEIQETTDTNVRRAKRSDEAQMSVYLPKEVLDNCTLESTYWLSKGKKPHKDYLVIEARTRECAFKGAQASGSYHIYPLAASKDFSLIKMKIRVDSDVLKNIKDELKFNLDNDTILESQSQVVVNRLIAHKFTPPAE